MKNLLISIVIPVASASEQEISLSMQERTTEPFKGKWEFPGGKVEQGESPEEAARREYLEECQAELENLVFFKNFNVRKEDKNICFFSYLTKPAKQLPHYRNFNFKGEENSQKYAGEFPDPNYRLIDEVIEYLADQVKCGDLDKLWT